VVPVRPLVDRLRLIDYFDGCGTSHLIFGLMPMWLSRLATIVTMVLLALAQLLLGPLK
jgi:hypothetical protein